MLKNPGKRTAPSNTTDNLNAWQLRHIAAAVFYFLCSALLMAQDTVHAHSDVHDAMNRNISSRVMAEFLREPGHSPMRAEELLQTALEYNPDNSDALFHLGRKRVREGRRLEGAEQLNNALISARWEYTAAVDAEREYIGLLLQMKRYDSIYSQYIADGRWMSYLNYSDILVDLLHSLYRSGDSAGAERLLQRALSRYPEDRRFKSLNIIFQELPLISDYRWLLQAWQRYDRGLLDERELPYISRAMLTYLLGMEVGEARQRMLAAYRSFPDPDPLSELIYLEELPYTRRRAYLADLEGGLALTDYMLLSAVRELNLEQLADSQEFFRFQFENFPLLSIDPDRDGHAEIEVQYLNQAIHLVRSDWNQDNIREREILFHRDDAGTVVPYALIIRESDMTLEIVYERYPDVHHAQLTRISDGRDEEISYFLSGEQYRLPAVRIQNRDFAFNFRAGILDMLQGQNGPEDFFLYSEPAVNQGLFLNELEDIQTLIDDFAPYIYLVESRFSSGNSAGEIHQSRYESNQIIASRYDTNADGIFELLHYYRDGDLQYRLRRDDLGTIYLAEFVNGTISVEQLIPADRYSSLPRELRPAESSALWRMPE